VHFTAPAFFRTNSYVGIFPADAPAGMAGKDEHTGYEYLHGKTSGTVGLAVPREPGTYTVRMYDRLQEVTRTSLEVRVP
jgi:hypothetical protein